MIDLYKIIAYCLPLISIAQYVVYNLPLQSTFYAYRIKLGIMRLSHILEQADYCLFCPSSYTHKCNIAENTFSYLTLFLYSVGF